MPVFGATKVRQFEDTYLHVPTITQIRRSLLEWYDEHHRVLPWRRNYHSKRLSREDDPSGAPLDLPLDVFMYYVMVCEVCIILPSLLLPTCCTHFFGQL